MEVKVVWHKRKKDMPSSSMVPKNEIHLWYREKVSKRNNFSSVEVRGVPLAYEVVFSEGNMDGGAIMNLKGEGFLMSYSSEDLDNFFFYMKVARKEAKMKITGEI